MNPSAVSATVPKPTGTRAPKNRLQALERLAETYSELTATLNAKGGIAGDGDSVAIGFHEPHCLIARTAPPRCSCCARTVREFERLCRAMRDDRHSALIRLESGEKTSVRALYWHLSEWHLKAQRVLTQPALKPRKNRRGQLQRQPVDDQGKPLPITRVLRNAEARRQLAVKALEWMSDNWTLDTEPMLPQELANTERTAA